MGSTNSFKTAQVFSEASDSTDLKIRLIQWENLVCRCSQSRDNDYKLKP